MNSKEKINYDQLLTNIIVPDTSVLIRDPKSLLRFLKEDNLVLLPLHVLIEIDNIKDRKADNSPEAREVSAIIEKYQYEHEKFQIVSNLSRKNLNFYDGQKGDHVILATLKYIYNAMYKKNLYRKYAKVKFISQDRNLRILARQILPEVIVEQYKFDKPVKEVKSAKPFVKITYFNDELVDSKQGFKYCKYDEKKHGKILENQLAICTKNSYFDKNDITNILLVRKGEILKEIDKSIKADVLTPYSNGGGINWMQYLAFHHLLDPEIKALFLVGTAGTGKTLMSIAAAVHMRHDYNSILCSRPAVFMSNKDEYGFLPGDLNEKMSPWVEPIKQAFNFLSDIRRKSNKKDNLRYEDLFGENGSSNNKTGGNCENPKFQIVPLNYIRGTTHHNKILIVDEAQNLSPHQIKTIITRMGENSKIIFTGDPFQIDVPKLKDESDNGMMYAISKLKNHPMIGVVHLEKAVRSKLSELAGELL
ncbi:PhoH family protein [Patescibacteria group bacterium]|nr:PhoH family protein [Patescibacteria group bacterium]